MVWGLVGVLVAACVAMLIIMQRYRRLNAHLYDKYKDIVDLEAAKLHVQLEIKTAQSQKENVEEEYREKRATLQRLVKEVALYEDEVDVASYGLYKPHFDYETSEGYKRKLLETRAKEKEMVRLGRAAICSTQWTVNGSEAKGTRQTRDYMKLMLRGFNGECDALISNVRWNNVYRMEGRLSKAFEAINQMGNTHSTAITEDYQSLKLDELRLTHEYRDKLHKEREEQRRIQEQMREEDKARREHEKAIEDANEEEKRHRAALDEARKELETASSEQVGKLNARIAGLESRLEETIRKKDRALSLAELTKAGHVYIISNIGSFGDDIFKIGMTRRFDPVDRVRELSGASVPFPFDVHAIVFAENAPELESRLHEAFYDRRMNRFNDRREFFNVSLDEIEKVVRDFNAEIELVKIPEAREFRETVAMRLREQGKANGKEKDKGVLGQFPESI